MSSGQPGVLGLDPEVAALSDERVVFNQVNLVVGDMAAMVEFYERLGVEFRPTFSPWDRHHRSFAASSEPDGFDFDLDSQSFVPQWNEGWPDGQIGPVFGFQVSSVEAVDEIFRDLTAAGYAGQQPPWDGFMGARYAVVVDPDGNSVGLMSPIDPARKSMPTPPED
jgi:catechol 2,3-dioxygenase-like lactoylglutathione lyase family enzyme